jgi:spore coat polysaccharide biosynthesis protein SpsF
MTRVLGSIEARMGSSRLPAKTLMPVYNQMSLLECVVTRFRKCKSIEDVVVATTVEANDDLIADWCEKNKVSYFRGSENDVLHRVVSAAKTYSADAIVQMGADSAYLDPELIDMLVAKYRSGDYDYVSNDLKLTYPLGVYGHVVKLSKLDELNKRATLSEKDRSDVVRFIFEHQDQYKLLNIEAPAEFRFPELRLTIDYPEDMEQAQAVYKHFNGVDFSIRDLLKLYQQRPEIFEKTKNLVQHSAPFLGKK